MSIVLHEYSAYAMFSSSIMIVFCLIFSFILTFFVPKVMLKTYFREPYFNAFEVGFFTGPLYSYMRTAMMMRLAGWPESGKKRGIPPNSHELCPLWFQIVSRWHIYITMASLGLFFISGGVFYILSRHLGVW